MFHVLFAFALAVTADQGQPQPRGYRPWPVEAQSPTTSLSSFGETQTVEKVPILSLDFNYAINSYFATTTTANGGTVTQATSMAVLQTSTNTAGSALLESKAAVRYIAGTGVYASFTALYTACIASSQQEVGLGDATDGFFIGCQGATFGVFLRKATADTFTAQSSWSVDHLDGTGPSGITLTKTNLTLFKISFGWHGAGPVKFYIFDVPNGRWVLFHVISAGVVAPRILNPTLPLHAKVINSGNATNLTVKTGSMGAYREGGPSPAPDEVSSAPGAVGAAKSVTTQANVITLRNNATVFSGQTNKVRVQVTQLAVANTNGGADVTFIAVLNTALGGAPSYTDFSATTSVVSFDVAGTTVTGGRVVFRVVVEASTAASLTQIIDLTKMQIILNPGDTLTVTATSAGAAQTTDVSIMFSELFTG